MASSTPTPRATPATGARAGQAAAEDDDYDLRGGFPGARPVPVRQAAEPIQPPSASRSVVGWRWVAITGALLVIAIVVIAVLAFRLGAHSSSTSGAAPAATTATTTTPTTLAVTEVYQRVVPSVVLITTSKGSLGSGVIVTDTGKILTANHVISDGGRVAVLFSDGTRAAATVSSADPASDIAVLTPAGLPGVVVPAVLGGGVSVGADVVAIGNPLGFTDSTTSGIVSGLNRTAKTDAGRFSGLIQFDAAVNPGSSGGPLLDSQGSVVGIVVSIADPGEDDSFAGIGFAVPIAGALGGGAGAGPGGGPLL